MHRARVPEHELRPGAQGGPREASALGTQHCSQVCLLLLAFARERTASECDELERRRSKDLKKEGRGRLMKETVGALSVLSSVSAWPHRLWFSLACFHIAGMWGMDANVL